MRTYCADVSNASAIEAATRAAYKDFGRLDVVVANAGRYTDTPALEMGEEEARFVTGANYFGPLFTAQAAARYGC